MDYRSLGDTRVTINGSRHYKTPYGALPSVTTILSATQGNKAALERWAKKNPGGKEAAAARGTKVHSLMEEYLLGIDKDPVIEDKEIAQFWEGLPENLSKLENIIWAENPANQDDFSWTKGSDGISRVWHPGFVENKNYGWAGAPDIVAEYKGKLVLGDLKTSNGPYSSKWPDSSTPKSEYGKRRSGFMKYQKCQLQMAAYALALEHTVGLNPELIMTFVATKEESQVFVIQKHTIEKYKQKWKDIVTKYYEEILPAKKKSEVEMEAINGDDNEPKKTGLCSIN